MAISSSPPRAHVDYPSEDGQPMAESDFQREPLTYAVEALGAYFQQRADVYVSGNLFIYYEEGNSEAVVAPDVFVVFGAPNTGARRICCGMNPKRPILSWRLRLDGPAARIKGQSVVPMRFSACRSMSYTIRRVITSDHRCEASHW